MKYLNLTNILMTLVTVLFIVNVLTGNILGAGLLLLSGSTLGYGTLKLNQSKKLDAGTHKVLS